MRGEAVREKGRRCDDVAQQKNSLTVMAGLGLCPYLRNGRLLFPGETAVLTVVQPYKSMILDAWADSSTDGAASVEHSIGLVMSTGETEVAPGALGTLAVITAVFLQVCVSPIYTPPHPTRLPAP